MFDIKIVTQKTYLSFLADTLLIVCIVNRFISNEWMAIKAEFFMRDEVYCSFCASIADH